MIRLKLLGIRFLSIGILVFLTSCIGNNQPTLKSNAIEHQASSTQKNKVSAISFDNGVYCSLLDSQGDLWFGSNGGGVYRYDGKSFRQYTTDDGLCNNKVCSIIEDSKGNLWFGTAEGLCRYDRKSFTNIAIPQSDTSSIWLDKVYPIVNPNQVMSLFQDQLDDLWIGTNGAGIYRYDGERFTQYLSNIGKVYEDGQQHNIVLSITEDKTGNIWFTSLSHAGVSRFDGTTFTHFTTEEGLSDNFIRTGFCDRKGNVWIGTHGNREGGLDRFDGQKFTNFRKTDDGLAQNNIHCIYEDKSGNLWLGSGRGNMTIFDGRNFEEFISEEGQKFDLILTILEDANGDIWFGGANGLWKYDGLDTKDMTPK